MGEELSYCEKVRAWFTKSKAFLLILSLQFGSAGMYIITMDALNKGLSHYVFVVYRNVVATLALGPFAFFLERKVRPKMTPRIFAEIVALAFIEIILDQCFTFLGMKLTSASFASAVMNSVPSITFVLAIIFRMNQGVVTSAIQFYVQGLVIKTTGPVFVTAFNPLRMIIVTAFASILLSEKLYLGSVIGGVVVVVGLYLVVWGKSKEKKGVKHAMLPPSPEKEIQQQQLPVTVPRNFDASNNNNNDDDDDNNMDHQLMVVVGIKNNDVEARRSSSC
ncbi:WAT1-related protein At4g08290 [Arachis duranensis]|uniref:WAT1-related protein n=1 Tax=Arachis duranensis TaxID=130453 RepID=A0A9C6WDS4_ARADU|nr:WAT1-related protein At4g08290 [Arachis duranensis]